MKYKRIIMSLLLFLTSSTWICSEDLPALTAKEQEEALKVYSKAENLKYPLNNYSFSIPTMNYASYQLNGTREKLFIKGTGKDGLNGKQVLIENIEGVLYVNGKAPAKALSFKRLMDIPYPSHTGTKGGDLAIGDLNGDKQAEIIITGLQSDKMVTDIFVLTSGVYKKAVDTGLPALDVGSRIALSDVDLDGDLDLVMYGKTAVNMQTSLFNVYFNDGKGKFTLSENLGLQLPSEDYEDTKTSWGGDDKDVKGLYDGQGWSSGGLNLVDLNGDKAPDIVYAACKGMESGTDAAGQMIQRDWETSGVFLNNGKGKFTYLTDGVMRTDTSYPGLVKAMRSATGTGDFNNDGKIDLILIGQANRGPLANAGIPETQRNGEPVSGVYLGKGDGTFKLLENHGIPDLIDGSISIGDFNKDGKLDAIVSGNTGHPGDPEGGRVTKIYSGTGTGVFKLDERQVYGYKPNDANSIRPVMSGETAVGDLDLDGDLEIVIAGNDNTRSLRIYDSVNGIYSQLLLVKAKNGIDTNTLDGRASPDAVSECDVRLYDIDADGDLDLILNGLGGAAQLLVFQNNLK